MPRSAGTLLRRATSALRPGRAPVTPADTLASPQGPARRARRACASPGTCAAKDCHAGNAVLSRTTMRLLLASLLGLSVAACAGPTTPPPNVPPNPGAPAPAPPPTLALASPEAFNIEGPLREEWMPLLKAQAVDPQKVRLSTAPPGLPKAPAACDAFVSRKGAAP